MSSATDPRERSPQVTPENHVFPAQSLQPVATKLESSAHPPPASRTGLWLHRLSLIIFVIFCIELGMLLTVLPWTRIWTDNSLISARPALRALVQDNFVRGIVTGIGLVDIWIGIWEAVHYRDPGNKNDL